MYKRTALITGASEGLGKSFAIELASRGYSLALAALPRSGLPELCTYLRKNYPIDVYCFETDLTEVHSANSLFKKLSDVQVTIDILINNAGLGNWSWFEEKPPDFYKKQIELNSITPVIMTYLFLEQLSGRQMAYLMNVGSLGGHFIVPKKQVYGATKSFISYFTRSLQLELPEARVKVSLLSPGGINTKPELLVMNQRLSGVSRSTIMEPEVIAKLAIDGMLKGKKEIIPGMANRLLLAFDKICPHYWKKAITRRQLKTILNA